MVEFIVLKIISVLLYLHMKEINNFTYSFS